MIIHMIHTYDIHIGIQIYIRYIKDLVNFTINFVMYIHQSLPVTYLSIYCSNPMKIVIDNKYILALLLIYKKKLSPVTA